MVLNHFWHSVGVVWEAHLLGGTITGTGVSIALSKGTGALKCSGTGSEMMVGLNIEIRNRADRTDTNESAASLQV